MDNCKQEEQIHPEARRDVGHHLAEEAAEIDRASGLGRSGERVDTLLGRGRVAGGLRLLAHASDDVVRGVEGYDVDDHPADEGRDRDDDDDDAGNDRGGEGEAEATRIFAKSFGQDPVFFSVWRTFQGYRDVFDAGGARLVLTPDNDYLRYLQAPPAPAAP